MASLFKRSGTYYVEFHDSTMTPKAKRYSLCSQYKQDARQLIADLERAWTQGRYDPWLESPSEFRNRKRQRESVTIGKALDLFLNEKRTAGCSAKTIENYELFCGQLAHYVGRQKTLIQIRPSHVRDIVYEEHLSQASRLTRFTHVRAWLRWCTKQGFIETCPTDSVPTPKRSKKMPKAVRPEQLKLIERAMQEDYSTKLKRNQINEGDIIWMIPMFWFALYSGLRSSELGRLRWKHIDLESGMLTILEQKNKREQTIPLTRPALEIPMQLDRGSKDEYVFHPPSGNSRDRGIQSFVGRVGKTFRCYRQQAGIDQAITVHGLRHGFCTLLAEAGKSAPIIMEAARHADISTSMRYVHVANKRLKEELQGAFSHHARHT